MIVKPGVRRHINSQSALLKRAQMIFTSNSYDGALYVAGDINSLNQTSIGTLPVSATTNPVGFQADLRLGYTLGTELVDTMNTAAAWTASGTNTVEDDAGAVKITYVDNAAGAVALLSAAAGLTTNLTVGANYKVTYQVKVNSGSCNAAMVNTVTNESQAITSTTFIEQAFVFTASDVAANTFTFTNLSAGEIVWIKSISIKLFQGNHSIQATAAARLTWQVDAGGRYYLSALGTDDSYTSATGGGGSAGFFWCGAIQPTGGAGTIRQLWSDTGANTGYKVRLDSNNKLSFVAGNGAVFTAKVSTATIDVGTKYLLTVWDDGTNLNVQINNATAETVARPVVVAGTAGFTRFADNGAASSYFIGYEYASVYFKDTGLTAAAREDMKKLVRSYGGL